MQVLVHKPLSLCVLTLMVIVTMIALFDSIEAKTGREEAILQNYRALGMDESVKMVKNDDEMTSSSALNPSPSDQGGWYIPPRLLNRKRPPLGPPEPHTTTEQPELPVDSLVGDDLPVEPAVDKPDLSDEDRAADHMFHSIGRGETVDRLENRVDAINYTKDHKDSQQLWLVPPKEGRHLTRLITAKEPSTFLQTNVAKPHMVDHTKEGPKKTLAQYTIMVPIWIPAVKPRKKVITTKPEEVKYVKETHTEMVPVTKNIAVTNTVVKPERVPQKIVTDFVKAPAGRLSSRIDDKLKPNEEVIGSTVTDFQ